MVERTPSGGWLPSLYEPIKRAGQKIADWFAPRSDAAATQDTYEITMELPGVQLDDIDVSLQDNMVVVTGEKQAEHESANKSYFFSEREYGIFQRAFRLPPDANPEAIDADFRNGVLIISIPKQRADATPSRKIVVRAQ
jgi:HSP20 family protein